MGTPDALLCEGMASSRFPMLLAAYILCGLEPKCSNIASGQLQNRTRPLSGSVQAETVSSFDRRAACRLHMGVYEILPGFWGLDLGVWPWQEFKGLKKSADKTASGLHVSGVKRTSHCDSFHRAPAEERAGTSCRVIGLYQFGKSKNNFLCLGS